MKKKLFLNQIKSEYVKKKNFFGKETLVLEIKVYDLSKYKSLVRFIEKLENYNVEIYNADFWAALIRFIMKWIYFSFYLFLPLA